MPHNLLYITLGFSGIREGQLATHTSAETSSPNVVLSR